MSTTPVRERPTQGTFNAVTQRTPKRIYRPELHGVRGLAILGVVLFHLLGNGRVSGGIDIFLAITGFLFTAMLLREAVENDGTVDFLRYFGRLARRIIAPAALVVIAITAAGLAILPATRHHQLWAEARASLLYFENIELINSQLAYGAAGPETSPFQHFWSLSVQGQFYLVWPVVAILAVLIARRLSVPAVRVMGIMVGVVLIASLAYAVYVGGFAQDKAYLMSTTRLWQLAFGGLLALLGTGLVLPRRLRLPAGWFGLALIVSCGFVLDGAELFPGLWSLWPLVGLALVLASAGSGGGHLDPRGSASRFLSGPIFAWIGNHAYALYLWHWPLLIYYLEIRERNAVGLRGAAVILTVAFLLAWLTHRCVETPLKNVQVRVGKARLRRLNKVSVGIALGALVAGGTVSTASITSAPEPAAFTESWDWEAYPGGSVAKGEQLPDVDYIPSLKELPSIRPDYYRWGCKQDSTNIPGSQDIVVCEDPNRPPNPKATVVLAAGSHAGHWTQAFRTLAERNRWELLIVDRSSCPFGDVTNENDEFCALWQDNFVTWLEHDRDVDLVVTPGTRMVLGEENIAAGAPERWEQITTTGTELLLLRGTPRGEKDLPDCLAEGNDPSACGPRVAQISPASPLETTSLPPGATTVDVVDHVCPAAAEGAARCSAVVGNVVVWYDGSHITNAFSGTMAPVIESHMREKLPWLFP